MWHWRASARPPPPLARSFVCLPSSVTLSTREWTNVHTHTRGIARVLDKSIARQIDSTSCDGLREPWFRSGLTHARG
uniref:Putative secreted protein n=1 Tax=Anopheles triannulatus TaxID=58253 RepID=A0A2M4B570_9DIPT